MFPSAPRDTSGITVETLRAELDHFRCSLTLEFHAIAERLMEEFNVRSYTSQQSSGDRQEAERCDKKKKIGAQPFSSHPVAAMGVDLDLSETPSTSSLRITDASRPRPTRESRSPPRINTPKLSRISQDTKSSNGSMKTTNSRSAQLLQFTNSEDAYDLLNLENLKDRSSSSSSEGEASLIRDVPMLLSVSERFNETNSYKEVAKVIVENRSFHVIVSSLIVLNSGLIGLEVDFIARHPHAKFPCYIGIADVFFCLCFVVELALKIFAYQIQFCRGPGWRWNFFDFAMVMMQVLDTCLHLLSRSERLNVAMLDFCRVTKLLRFLRIARLLNSFRDLRLLVVAFIGSFKGLVWTVLLLSTALYGFGVFVTSLVADRRAQPKWNEHSKMSNELRAMFGNLPSTLLTLYESITGGVAWSEAAIPLGEEVSPLLYLGFSLYIAIMIFALLNAVTGVVLNSAMQGAEEDRRHSIANQMGQFFKDADANHSGTLDLLEFENHLHDHNLQVSLRSLGITTEDARHLFNVIEESSACLEISPDLFVSACVRWGAPAKKIDYALLQREMKRTSSIIQDQIKDVHDLNCNVHSLTSDLRAEVRFVHGLLKELHGRRIAL